MKLLFNINKSNWLLILLFQSQLLAAAKPPESEKIDPTEIVVIDDFPSPYDNDAIDLEAMIWRPAGPGPFPAIIMMHGVGGLYYKTDDMCADDDRSCWDISGKFKYWGKQLSESHYYDFADRFIVIAPDSHTPRGYDHFGVANIDAQDRPLNVSSYLGRPWDFYAALRYLQTRDDVDADAIFALGFSDGGGAVLSSVAASNNAALVNESDWFSGIDNNDPFGWMEMQAIGVKAAVAYYPSCGFFGYFDEVYTNYAPLLIQTGLDDETTPISRCLERQLEAFNLGVHSTDLQVLGYPGMDHGFDYEQYETVAACQAAEKTIAFFSSHLGDYLFKSSFEPSVCP